MIKLTKVSTFLVLIFSGCLQSYDEFSLPLEVRPVRLYLAESLTQCQFEAAKKAITFWRSFCVDIEGPVRVSDKRRFKNEGDIIILAEEVTEPNLIGQALRIPEIPYTKIVGGYIWLKGCNYPTIAHEIGHIFGLRHSNVKHSLMYPVIEGGLNLSEYEIDTVLGCHKN